MNPVERKALERILENIDLYNKNLHYYDFKCVQDAISAILVADSYTEVEEKQKQSYTYQEYKSMAAIYCNANVNTCPLCQSQLVARKTKSNIQFWGCSAFPKCKGVRDFFTRQPSVNQAMKDFLHKKLGTEDTKKEFKDTGKWDLIIT